MSLCRVKCWAELYKHSARACFSTSPPALGPGSGRGSRKLDCAVLSRAGDTCTEKAGLSNSTADERLTLSLLDSACKSTKLEFRV